LRVGVDVASVSAVSRSIDQFGDRYLRRIFTPLERANCAGLGGPMAEKLAARFAAKEACIKILRPDGQQINWQSIEVRREHDDSCSIDLSGDAAELALRSGINDLAVALSHEGDVAVAVVFAHCEPPPTMHPRAAK
jgi:holo-[acyl-carrier protein] synthase